MKTIEEILSELLLNKFTFHKVTEHDIYQDALLHYLNQKYCSSALLAASLYEMIFTTRLIRETSNPGGFIPDKNNINEQFQNLLNREEEVVNGKKKMFFRNITEELVQKNVITNEEKGDYDNFYSKLRNPVSHGLTARLYKDLLDGEPKNSFEIDERCNEIYKIASEKLVYKIYEIMAVKKLLKK
jgi:hypothetical protein